ncbi:MAG: TetR/AcrR family transcriptional regulator [Salaquimonas sp.]
MSSQGPDTPAKTVLRRDDSEQEPLVGNIKVTRDDWLNVAMDVLISDGIGDVKVMPLGERLGVSRSSFYWYFKSRQDLLNSLLQHWEKTNTSALVSHCNLPAKSITEAVCNLFRCFIAPETFNTQLDFAVRDWARKSGKVRRILNRSDQTRIEAIEAMFCRFGFTNLEALARARTLYFMQMGYNVAELNETIEDRLRLLPEYVHCFTGIYASEAELEDFNLFAKI